ncbi:hypothetical protein ANCDUO_09802 [Ancylostoma duodenale]|uniref:Uncharacterized protein n=1 Tax=Ancylostoma duodenale TaxID=51022 RepID=A0A0C2GLX9_9BILA|nr:hypothetical protein ANCDUO_09802 [Ancylostoma duodenale]
MFGDIFTCVLGLGAAMWTRKPVLTLPCTMIQLLFLLIRAVVWTARGYNKALLRVESSSEDRVSCESANIENQQCTYSRDSPIHYIRQFTINY